MKPASSCLSCRASGVQVLVDFGPQPPSNRFEAQNPGQGETHPLVVGQCPRCALIQLIHPMAPGMAMSRFEWLTYREPEGHLDDLVSRLREWRSTVRKFEGSGKSASQPSRKSGTCP